MLLETARRYNHETECITFLKDFTYSKDDFHRAGVAGSRLAEGAGPCCLGDGGLPHSCLLSGFLSVKWGEGRGTLAVREEYLYGVLALPSRAQCSVRQRGLCCHLRPLGGD